MELKELKTRLYLADVAVKLLEKEPKAGEALNYYRAQKAELEKLIAEEEAKPHDVVIRLKTAKLTVRRE